MLMLMHTKATAKKEIWQSRDMDTIMNMNTDMVMDLDADMDTNEHTVDMGTNQETDTDIWHENCNFVQVCNATTS